MFGLSNDSIAIKNSYSIVVLYVVLYSIFPTGTKAQIQYNLVPNYSFEEYTNCPSGATYYEALNTKPDFWYKPDKRNAAYFNSCAAESTYASVPNNGLNGGFSFQYARTGVAYVSMFYWNNNNQRNYFQVKLTDSLQQGKCYYAECFVSLGNSQRFACNNHSMLFTNNPVYADTIAGLAIIPANPQIQSTQVIADTLNWVKVSGVFTAQGSEQYLTLGNFKYDNQTTYQQFQVNFSSNGAIYYVDDVSVIPLDSITLQADAGEDRVITAGDSVFIGSYTTGLTNVVWYNSSGNIIATNTAGFYVQPAASTFYVIEQNVCGQYSKDTVYITVGVVPLVIKNYELKIKNEGVVNKWITLNEINVSHFNVQRSSNGIEFNTIQQTAAKNNAYNEYSITDAQPLNGVSYYRIEAVDKDGKITYSKTEKVQIKIDKEQLTVFPNPATSVVNIVSPNIQQVIIYDVTGRIVFNRQLNGVDNTQLNISGIGKGMFFVKVTDKKGHIQTQKLMIQ
ncbi:MAG: T9SS type A sorting domain-containing protein [Chitinophagales bacterium]|nr:T9SS type A sorting domain-containing protein [Chitinophagales bacterium]